MISAIVRVTDKHVNSKHLSIQQEHIELYLKGSLFSICVFTKENEYIEEFKGNDLSRLLGTALQNGRRTGTNFYTGATEFYYLGER